MQNSSRKSWTQSRSPASGPPPPEPKQKTPLSEEKVGFDNAVPGPDSANVKMPFAIPLGPVSIILESRFWVALFLSSTIYLLAAFLANEWMYLLSAGFFIAVVLGWVLPLIEVLDVVVDPFMPEEVLVEENAELRLRIRRRWRLLSLMPVSYMRIRVNLLRRVVPGQPVERVLSAEPLLLDQISDEVWLNYPILGLRRGLYKLVSVELISCYPFGIVWWIRAIKRKLDVRGNPLTLTVHPKQVALSGNFLFQLKGVTSAMGLSSSSSVLVVQSTSVRGVREFKVGDSIRHIHWPSSARLGKLLVREFESETLPVFDVMLDLRAAWRSREQFELAVCLVHSLIHLGHRLGMLPELFLNPPLDSVVLSTGLMAELPQMPPGLDQMAEILSRVEPLTQNISDDDEKGLDTPVHKRSEKPLVAVYPLQDKIMKYAPGRGDILVYPIELLVIPRNWDEIVSAKVADKDDLQFKASRTAGQRRRTIQKTTDMAVIARLDSEVDLEPL